MPASKNSAELNLKVYKAQMRTSINDAFNLELLGMISSGYFSSLLNLDASQGEDILSAFFL